MTAEQRKAVEEDASKLAKECCNPSDEVIELQRQTIYDYLNFAFIAGAEFALDKLDKPYKDLSKQIEEAISTTLVVQNKQSIDIAVSKIVKLLNADI